MENIDNKDIFDQLDKTLENNLGENDINIKNVHLDIIQILKLTQNIYNKFSQLEDIMKNLQTRVFIIENKLENLNINEIENNDFIKQNNSSKTNNELKDIDDYIEFENNITNIKKDIEDIDKKYIDTTLMYNKLNKCVTKKIKK